MPHAKYPTPLHLEGSTLEGGGQLLRVALGLSALIKKPINITNIRGKRHGGGGLKAQHLTCVQWLGQACNARLSGIGLKSKEITFSPSQNPTSLNIDSTGGEIRITQNTPGSINLVFQAILPFLLFSGASSPIRVRISGGTNVSNSPSHEYISEVLLPMLTHIGIPSSSVQLHSRGWSQGRTCVGSMTFTIKPLTGKLPAFSLVERGSITRVKAIIVAPRETERDFRDELELMFDKRASMIFGANTQDWDTDIMFEPSHHEKRYSLLLIATSSTGIKLGRDWLYDQAIRPGKSEHIPRTMVKQVSDELLGEIAHGGCVDEYARDQVVVFQALAEGKSRVDAGLKDGVNNRLSLHTRTAMWVAEKMLGVKFDEEGGCEGIAFDPRVSKSEEEGITHLAGDIQNLNISTT
ncbi:RNA 3'-terminal phosphate cyclase domain-containing protein [Paraphoma chrysanthemicola]|uniref:RNA 3'-terminal phosphate cyclase domain-containing protein n=1 Tax=Paraphoma chrysanthemicola TaxID=798071 RepID=A0A8K0W255_9PLEO|nr:RNA 3'-terminal phosphate cyclase domain-containing protein [Paraphoma chrysanthemicola]